MNYKKLCLYTFVCVAVSFFAGCGQPKPSDEESVLVNALSGAGANVIASHLGKGESVVLLQNKTLSGVDPFKTDLRKNISARLKKNGLKLEGQEILEPDAISMIRGGAGDLSDKGIKETVYRELVSEYSDVDAFVSFAGPVHLEENENISVPFVVVFPYRPPHLDRMEESLMNGEALMWIVRHPAWPDVMSVSDLSPEEQFNKLFMVVTEDTLDAYFDALDAE